MTLANHIRMGRLISKKLHGSDMPLNKRMFLLGNIAPDLFFSYIYRPHCRASSGDYLNTRLQRLFESGSDPGGAVFSFRLGVMAHYVCDFLCYVHTPAFTGSSREHMRYEHSQTVADDARPFNGLSGMNVSHAELTGALSEYIAQREQLLSRDAAAAVSDIPVAVHMAAWAASAVYLHAMSASCAPDPDGEERPIEAAV